MDSGASLPFDEVSAASELENEDLLDLDRYIDSYLLQMQGSQQLTAARVLLKAMPNALGRGLGGHLCQRTF